MQRISELSSKPFATRSTTPFVIPRGMEVLGYLRLPETSQGSVAGVPKMETVPRDVMEDLAKRYPQFGHLFRLPAATAVVPARQMPKGGSVVDTLDTLADRAKTATAGSLLIGGSLR